MKITIVGGGTAGWIAAFFISKSQPNIHEISVIESSSIGIIGAGEGSTGSFVELLSGSFFNYKININNFIKETDATNKMGIRHINWGHINNNYFAPLDVSPTAFEISDYIFKYVLLKYGKEKMHLASKIGIEYENKQYHNTYALHFDGHKVGNFFKKICLQDNNINVYNSIIEDIIVENNKIQKIVLESKKEIISDFFIDCSGFSRLLMKKLDIKWISKKNKLFVNSAMPFILPKDEIFIPETKAIALSSGWMWEIPLQTRKGCGYVYNDKFITDQDAKNEIENYFNTSINPIKFIKFDAGYSELFWKENVLGLGLASSFVEPLEATSINNTIIQLAIFVKEFLKPDIDKTNLDSYKKIYNKRIKFLNDLTIDFIALHYIGKRNDTEFWKHVQKKKKSEHLDFLIDIASKQVPSFILHEGMYGSWSLPLANWIFAGLDMFDPKIILDDLKKFHDINNIEILYKNFYKSVNNYKNYILYND